MLPLIHLARIDSTQSFLARHPELGFCAVMADAQTAGKGRGGNVWDSQMGAGLWLSARIPPPDLPPGLVLQKAMTAVVAALSCSDVTLGLKWPNDLVAHREGRLVKVGGILGESASGRMILGLGVNLNAAPDLPQRAIPPACLAELGARFIPTPSQLAQEILKRWGALESTEETFVFRWPPQGEVLRWEGGQGVCLGWEADGRLRVITSQGIEWLSVGDVTGLGQV